MMPDPFGSMQGFLNKFCGFMQNPAQMLMGRGLPQNAMQNPQATVQQLLNSGQMTQDQFNQLQRMAKQIQGNPMFAQMFGGK